MVGFVEIFIERLLGACRSVVWFRWTNTPHNCWLNMSDSSKMFMFEV